MSDIDNYQWDCSELVKVILTCKSIKVDLLQMRENQIICLSSLTQIVL